MMDASPNPLRGGLLAQVEPDREKFARYRVEVDAMLEQKEKSLRRQYWYAASSWVFAVLLATAFVVVGAVSGDSPRWFWPAMTGMILLIAAAVELVKYFLNRARLELLREIKRVELSILERGESTKA
jgi:hypothetical protein